MNMMLTEVEARALAKAIEAMRPDWNEPGIFKALGYARYKGNKWTVTLAAISCAANPDNRTPAVIPMEGRHWPVMEAPKAPPRPKREELTEEEREAAHRQYLAARALLTGREPRCRCGVLKSEPAAWCAGHAEPVES
jgi:hypothetical protein